MLQVGIITTKDIELTHTHPLFGFQVEESFYKHTYIVYQKEVTPLDKEEESNNEKMVSKFINISYVPNRPTSERTDIYTNI